MYSGGRVAGGVVAGKEAFGHPDDAILSQNVNSRGDFRSGNNEVQRSVVVYVARGRSAVRYYR